MLDMQVIEALYLNNEEPHDYLHIKQLSAFLSRYATGWMAQPVIGSFMFGVVRGYRVWGCRVLAAC